jgi:hypothetical protein
MWRLALCCCAVTTLAFVSSAHAATLVVQALPDEQSSDLQVLARLSRAYGLDLVAAKSLPSNSPADPIAIVTTARFAAARGRDVLAATLQRPWASKLPLIVIGDGMPTRAQACAYEVTAPPPLGNPVRGMRFGCVGAGKPGAAHQLPQADSASETLVALLAESGGAATRQAASTRSKENGRLVYRIASVGDEPLGDHSLADLLHTRFGTAGSLAIILGGIAGERAWHVDAVDANFTIDDPWLKEPYGGLSYERELKRMERSNFHTTIGFVPWNFGRSDPQVARIVRTHPHRFSIAIHGNNHDHEEFGEHNSVQTSEKNVRQALARMREFSNRSGVPHDRVMVFPQQVAPDDVLGLLRKHRFACTVNLQNRRDRRAEPGFTDSLWGGFVYLGQGIPSLKRELPNTPITYLGVLALLGRPLLLHAHQDYYLDNDFSEIARRINAMSTPVRWSSLGDVCSRLWLRKLGHDGNYDVMIYGTHSKIRNPAADRRLFRFKQRTDGAVSVASIEIDGRSVPFKTTSDEVNFEVELDGLSTASIVTRYADEVAFGETPSDVSIARVEPRVAALRLLSDVRDTLLAHSALGRWITTSYYGSIKGSYRAIDTVLTAVAVLAVTWITAAVFILVFRSRRAGRSSQGGPTV